MTDPVSVRDATISLSGREVVHQASLNVGPGEFVALLGANGSGKSTLMRAAVGLVRPDSGSLSLFGTAQHRFRDWHRIGYVPQKPTAASGVPSTVREVVMSGRLSRRRFTGIPTARDRRAVAEAISLVGLTDRGRDSAAELSGGQQQRVMLARGLAGDPDLLVMDEPMAGVDQRSQEHLANVFSGLLEAGRSIWMIAHELGPFASLVDRVVALRDGRVTYDGPPTGQFAALMNTTADPDHHQTEQLQLALGVQTTGPWSP